MGGTGCHRWSKRLMYYLIEGCCREPREPKELVRSTSCRQASVDNEPVVSEPESLMVDQILAGCRWTYCRVVRRRRRAHCPPAQIVYQSISRRASEPPR
jgi:hypothetical protein